MLGTNPSYSTVPETPPGFQSIPYIIGGMLAPGLGGIQTPYVPANQSVHDAWLAKHVTDPVYREIMGNVYGQLGTQLGNTIGRTRMFQSLASLSGYSPERIQRDMAGLGGGIGRSALGQFIMPLADSLLTQSGISGGSFVGAAKHVIDNRMSLLSPTMMLNPYSGQQSQSLGAASAMIGMLNSAISQRDGSKALTPKPNLEFTQGFDREQLAKLAMGMAGAGGLTTAQGTISERLTAAARGYELKNLDAVAGDFENKTGSANIKGVTAEGVKRVSDDFKKRMESGIKAMGAMRDLLKEVDGIQEKLTAMTNGEWLRSPGGADAAAASVRQLEGVTKAFNLDPKKAWSAMISNRAALQDAAGFTPAMQAVGMDGGGMFRLGAQTDFLSNVESMITARGVRGDPIKANALRAQAVQAMSRNMNTQAGVAAQVLAYGRQLGVISKKDADAFQADLTSGDQSVMGDSLNRMLTTVFGSAKKGRELMQDSMFVNSMRQSLNDEAGRYALATITKGADSEFMRQEKVNVAADRAAFSKGLLAESGMRVKQSDAEVGRIVDSVSASLQSAKDGGEKYATAFREQFENRVAGGMNRNVALQATLRAFKQNPATAKFAERMTVAMNNQMADNNEAAYREGGLQSGQAKAVADALKASGLISGKQHGSVLRLIREGKGAEALASVDSITSSLSSSQQALFGEVKADAEKRYTAAIQTTEDKKAANALIETAGKSGYGSNAVVESYTSVIDAANTYLKSKRTDEDFNKFQDVLASSRYGAIFGDKENDRLLKAIRGPDAEKMVTAMGRQSVNLRQLAMTGLKNKGYDLTYNGFWGGGKYAGNDEESASRRDEVIGNIVSNINSENLKSHELRSTFGQDFVDLLTGDKNWQDVLKIRIGEKEADGLTGDYAKAFKAYTDANKDFTDKKHDTAIGDAIKALNLEDRFDSARTLRDMAGKGMYDEKQLDAFMSANGISGESATKLKEAMKANADVHGLRNKANAALEGISKKEGFSEMASLFMAGKRYDDAKKKHYAATGAFMDDLDADTLDSRTGGKLGEAVAALGGAVTDEAVAAKLGVASLDKVKNRGLVNRTRLDLLKEQAEGGDSKSMAAMEKFRAAAKENVGKIKGELTIKIGNEQYAGILEGNMGGLG